MEALDPEIAAYELERGKPVPGLRQALIQSNLVVALTQKLGVGYIALPQLRLALDDRNIMPDICIFRRSDLTVEQITVATRPLMAIEILSPTQAIAELLAKAGRYFAAGV